MRSCRVGVSNIVVREYIGRYLKIDTGNYQYRVALHITNEIDNGHECKGDARSKYAKYHAPLMSRQLDSPKTAQR